MCLKWRKGSSPLLCTYTPLAQRIRARGYGPRYAGSIPVWGTLNAFVAQW